MLSEDTSNQVDRAREGVKTLDSNKMLPFLDERVWIKYMLVPN